MDCSDFLEVNIHLTAAVPPDDPSDPMAQVRCFMSATAIW